MIIYRFRPDMIYDCEVEVPDGTKAIPPYHTFQKPPEQEGHYAIMMGGWKLLEGEKPSYPPPPLPEPEPEPVDPEVEKQRFNAQQKALREQAYREESDPLYFKAQRSEGTTEEWLNKVEEIKNRYPYQE
jgi:hypothetical protein